MLIDEEAALDPAPLDDPASEAVALATSVIFMVPDGFGDLADRESRVARLFASPRATRLLGELGTGPRVVYLERQDWSAGEP